MITSNNKGKRHTQTKRVANNNNINIIAEDALSSIQLTHSLNVKQFMLSIVNLDETNKTVNKMSKRMFNLDEDEMIGFEYFEVVVRRFKGSVGQPRKLFKIRIPLHLTQSR